MILPRVRRFAILGVWIYRALIKSLLSTGTISSSLANLTYLTRSAGWRITRAPFLQPTAPWKILHILTFKLTSSQAPFLHLPVASPTSHGLAWEITGITDLLLMATHFILDITDTEWSHLISHERKEDHSRQILTITWLFRLRNRLSGSIPSSLETSDPTSSTCISVGRDYPFVPV